MPFHVLENELKSVNFLGTAIEFRTPGCDVCSKIAHAFQEAVRKSSTSLNMRSYTELIGGSIGSAFWASQSLTGKSPNPPDRLSGRATQRSISDQISLTGSQEEPLNPVEALRSAGLAHRKSHSAAGRALDPLKWLSGRATRQPEGH